MSRSRAGSGIPLNDGDNRLVARVLDADGRVVKTLDRTVHYVGHADARRVRCRASSRLVADGLTRPLIAVRVTDKNGRPVRAGTLVPFRVDQPYTAAIEAELEQGRQLAGLRSLADHRAGRRRRRPRLHRAAADDAGRRGQHQASSLDRRQDRAHQRGSRLAVRAPQGLDGRRLRRGHDRLRHAAQARQRAAALASAARSSPTASSRFYAKGRVKGSWLLTIAYDSDRKYDPDRGLLGTIDPDRYYTVYGDGSQQGYDAPTRRKLYLRLERREFYALFGDFETGFTDTQLTRYSRTLNGVKAAYEGEHVRATGFAANTDTLYSRDEIQGNGLSGPYRLSGRNIVPNSDKLRSRCATASARELIVSSTALTRHIDYDIDASDGTIRFREPVLSRDRSLNPIFIVADYEVEGGRSSQARRRRRASPRGWPAAASNSASAASATRPSSHGDRRRRRPQGAGRRAPPNCAPRPRPAGATACAKGQAYLAEVDHHGAAARRARLCPPAGR